MSDNDTYMLTIYPPSLNINHNNSYESKIVNYQSNKLIMFIYRWHKSKKKFIIKPLSIIKALLDPLYKIYAHIYVLSIVLVLLGYVNMLRKINDIKNNIITHND